MKTLYSLSSLCLLLLVMFSCEDSNESAKTQGFIQFRYGITERSAKTLDTLDNAEPAAVVISVKRGNTVIFEHLRLSLFSFGEGFVSESLQLTTGNYLLMEFMVVDANNHVLYATPFGGSEQAQFVTQPLSIPFSVTEEGSTLVVPEVLEVTDDQSPESYGYVSFAFNVVDPYNGLPANSVQLKVDGILWRATYLEQVVYRDSSKYFVLTGRKLLNDSINESLWIIIQDFKFNAPVQNDNVELQMGFNESQWTGSYWDSDWHSGHPKVVTFSITEYDTLHHTVSGTFSGHIYNPFDETTKIITDGVFYKAKVTFQ